MPSVASRRLEARLPTPPTYRRGGRKRGPSLTQFVVLSLLLHALFILLFGSPTGGSPQGRAMWGSLDVTIRGPLLDSGRGTNAAREPMRLPGSELLERRREAKETAAPPVAVTPPVTITPPAPAIAPVPVRPLPDAGAAQVVDIAPVPPALLETPVLPAATDLVPAPRVAPVPREIPAVSVPTLEFAPRPAIETNLAPPAEVLPAPKPRAAPVVPAPPLSSSTLPAVTPILDSAVNIAAPAPREPVAVPVPAPMLPATTVPVATPNLDPAATIAPPAPRTSQPPAPAAPPATARPAATAAERPAAREREPASAGTGSPRDSPIFDNRRPSTPEAPPPGGAPRIDLEAARARAREVAREGTGNRALLPFPMPPAPERKTKEQLAIEKAWKPDCKDAYKGLGLLAVVPLLANEIGEGTCRW